MSFADKLRQLREERFLSQAELARRSGVHKLTVQRLEAGTTSPYSRTVRRLADALGVEPRELALPGEVAEKRREYRVRTDDDPPTGTNWPAI